MLLTPDKSVCERRQKIIVSKDQREQRQHRAENPDQKYEVRHYRLDGDLVSQTTCCDFLLINDTTKKAYFIELKGRHLDDAVPQLEEGFKLFRTELEGCSFYFRIVASKVRTHAVNSPGFRKFKDKWGSRLKYNSRTLKDTLE